MQINNLALAVLGIFLFLLQNLNNKHKVIKNKRFYLIF